MTGNMRFSRIVFIATAVFLFMPLFVLVVYSFNESRTMQWEGFSFIWYEELFSGSRGLWQAFFNSLVIALMSATTATIIGTLGAIGVNWHRFRGKRLLQALTHVPLILPEIIIGVSLLIFFAGIGLKQGIFTIFLAHTSFNLPFVFLMVLSRLEEFDASIIEAACDLGARERDILLRIIIPISLPGILAGFLTALTLSLEDFVITFFVSGPGSTTLPLYVYGMIRFGVSPVINALSVVLILGTLLLVFLTRRVVKYVVKNQ